MLFKSSNAAAGVIIISVTGISVHNRGHIPPPPFVTRVTKEPPEVETVHDCVDLHALDEPSPLTIAEVFKQ